MMSSPTATSRPASAYVPSPEQIAAKCRAIRREWSDREYIKRARGLDLALMVEHFAGLARSDERRETRYRRESRRRRSEE